MPSAEDLKSFSRINHDTAASNAKMVPQFPSLPEELKVRFPSLKEWEGRVRDWEAKMGLTVRGGPV